VDLLHDLERTMTPAADKSGKNRQLEEILHTARTEKAKVKGATFEWE
jgi:hypothetical protein